MAHLLAKPIQTRFEGAHRATEKLVKNIFFMFSSLQAYNNAEHWVQSFKLVRKIVGGVDYKGVREIMKNCIEKASLLPQGSNKWKIFSIKRYFYSDSDP